MSPAIGSTLFIGGLALFLYGTQVLTDSFGREFGGGFKKALGRLAARRSGAFAFGAILAGGTQSSSVAASLAVGLVEAGLLPLSGALAAVMGASVGAMAVTFLLGFDWTVFSPLFLACCVIGRKLPEGPLRRASENFIGLALLLSGMALLKLGLGPLSAAAPVMRWAAFFGAAPAAVFLVSTLLAAVLQSGNAVVAVAIALLSGGLLPIEAVFPMVSGAHLGTSAPVMLVSLGTRKKNARRLAWANLLYRAGGVLASGAAWGLLSGNALLSAAPASMAPSLALGFVVTLNALLFYPFTGHFARVLERIPLQERESLAEPLYLDDAVLTLPAVALRLLSREMARLANFTDELLTRVLLFPGPSARVEALRKDLPALAESCLDFMFAIPAPPEGDPSRAAYSVVSYALIAMRSLVSVAANRLVPLCLDGECEGVGARLRESDWQGMAGRLVRLVGFALGSFVLGDSDLSRRALDLGKAFERDADSLRAKLLEGKGLFDSRSEVAAWEFISAASDLVRAASEIARSEETGKLLAWEGEGGSVDVRFEG